MHVCKSWLGVLLPCALIRQVLFTSIFGTPSAAAISRYGVNTNTSTGNILYSASVVPLSRRERQRSVPLLTENSSAVAVVYWYAVARPKIRRSECQRKCRAIHRAREHLPR